MSKNKNKVIDNLVSAGVIGATLGALVSKSKGQGAFLGGLAGVAIAASLEAYNQAEKTKLPILVEEEDVLYELRSNGKRKKIKKLPHSNTVLPKKFVLE